MARMARVVVAGIAHHVVQRGNRRQKVFFREDDKSEYLRILKKQSDRFGLKIWAYCLMTNHVHLIAVPENESSLARAVGEAHRRYTRMINFREKWRGYLWQGRFQSSPLDAQYLYAAVRYVERNPVRAKMVKRAEDYFWSSARAHVLGHKDDILSHFYLLDEINDWSAYLRENEKEKQVDLIRKHICTGRPLGAEDFVTGLEQKLGLILHKRKPGPSGK